VYPRAESGEPRKDNIRKVVYDHGMIPTSKTRTTDPLFAVPGASSTRPTLSSPEALHTWPLFDEIKGRVQSEWESLPKVHDPVSQELRDKIKHILASEKHFA
jgi:hypothetical protein